MELRIGIKNSSDIIVDDTNVASIYGDHLPQVFATPNMIAKMEEVASSSLIEYLSDDEISVGANVNIDHISATPRGVKVRVDSEIIEIDRSKIVFKLEAFDEFGQIGAGTHTRYILNKSKFDKALDNKKK